MEEACGEREGEVEMEEGRGGGKGKERLWGCLLVVVSLKLSQNCRTHRH